MEYDPTRSYKQLPLTVGYPKIYLDAFGSSDGRNTKEFLWFPEPIPIRGEVQIGDVGVVQEGAFLRMWNITLPFRTDVGPNYEAPPPGFKHPNFNPATDVLSSWDYMRCSEPFCSDGVKLKEKRTEPDPKTGTRDVYTFSAMNLQAGGIVIPLDRVERRYVKDKIRKNWESLVDANRKIWKKYSTCTTYTADELLLVTGCVKTSVWVIAALQGSGDFNIVVRPSGPFPVDFIQTPTVRGTVHSSIGLAKINEEVNQIRAEAGFPLLPRPGFDHCLVVEARRFAKRDRSRMWVDPDMKANAEPQDPQYYPDNENSSAVLAQDTLSVENPFSSLADTVRKLACKGPVLTHLKTSTVSSASEVMRLEAVSPLHDLPAYRGYKVLPSPAASLLLSSYKSGSALERTQPQAAAQTC